MLPAIELFYMAQYCCGEVTADRRTGMVVSVHEDDKTAAENMHKNLCCS